MNIVVAMKQIPDLQQIRIRDRQPIFEDVPLTLGSIDKNALEAAVQIKEQQDAQVTVLSVGDENVEDTIKEAMAAGADQCYLVLDDELKNAESSVTAVILAAALQQMEDKPDLILFGEGSGDNYSGQVGSRVAAILDLPQVGFASSIVVEDGRATITRSLENSEEVVEVSLPAVVTVMADINEPRIPSVSQILKAGRKPKEVVEPDELDVSIEAGKIDTISNLAPETERKRIVVKSVDELIQALSSEALIGR
ncbi:MAG: electron transfer flavoprotein subunit beta/FixA family protein [Syntrophomonadaceae bacterium]|nr:electron transfer flavoprotein subunit beta/FixA family protein [Syntrophomonadaceae bacterium]